MAGMILRRLASAVGVLLLASIVIFLVIAVSGDPLGELRDRQPPVSETVIQAEEARLGLDQPLHIRYLDWVSGLFQGDLGPSTVATRDIGAEIGSHIGVTLRLVVVAVAIALVLALIAGTISGLRQHRFPDVVITPMTTV